MGQIFSGYGTDGKYQCGYSFGCGGYMVIQKQMTVGELVAFFSLIWYIIGPMWNIGFHINNYTQSKASGEKIIEILHQYTHVKDKEDAIVLRPDDV
jgi:ATP-binding cassette, subfamily B, multidrug efflux pump